MSAKLSCCKLTYYQESDVCNKTDSGQVLHVSMVDGGGGKYFVIKTKRWAFDSIEELVKTLQDAAKRFGL